MQLSKEERERGGMWDMDTKWHRQSLLMTLVT